MNNGRKVGPIPAHILERIYADDRAYNRAPQRGRAVEGFCYAVALFAVVYFGAQFMRGLI